MSTTPMLGGVNAELLQYFALLSHSATDRFNRDLKSASAPCGVVKHDLDVNHLAQTGIEKNRQVRTLLC